jgi:hypothetical protein
LKFELLALEENIVESPSFSGQDTWQAHFTLLDHQCKVDGSRAGISCSPRFTRTGIRDMSISSERLAVYPGLRDSVHRLRFGKSKKTRDYCGRSDFDKDNVIKADGVKAVLQRKTSLNLPD